MVKSKSSPEGPFEIEVKFYLNDPGAVRERIVALGAIPGERVFESNIRYEDADRSLIQNKSLLRLRKDSKTKLTFKSSPPDGVYSRQFKIRRELEVEIGDFDTMAQILESLGFRKQQIYEKHRETFTYENTSLCLDEMPYGVFLEIEGGKDDILMIAKQIGMQWEKRILTSYLAIFEIIKRKARLPFHDITFDNFKGIGVDPEWFLSRIEAGK